MGKHRKPCSREEHCPISPKLPEQGGIMPVLWQPVAQTNLHLDDVTVAAVYTLNVVTTQWIDQGVLLRFQMWNGLTTTYADAVSSSVLAEFDLIVTEPIPPATVLVVSMNSSGTAIYSFTGTTTYARGGKAVAAPFFTIGSSLLAFAFVPTASCGWAPARGKPMFAIGFNVPDVSQVPACCAEGYGDITTYPGSVSSTAPNFPDQWSGAPVYWTFDYEVVYPFVSDNPLASRTPELGDDCCIEVPGIKVHSMTPLYILGSWSNLRDWLAQPWTVVKDNYYSTSRWGVYLTSEDADVTSSMTPDVGPFILAAAPGQLVVVYFRPRYKDIDLNNAAVPNNGQPFTYRDSGSAEVALLVTECLQPNQTIYFTNETYNAGFGGFGPRHSSTGSASFVNHDPAFVWNTGCSIIPAGTVVVIRGIGAAAPATITIENAHDSRADVGNISNIITNFGDGTPIVSLMVCSSWIQLYIGSSKPVTASMFVTAVLSDQYAGDFPPLSPSLTIARTRFSGSIIYGRGKVFDNAGLPSTVQCSLINSAAFTKVYDNESVPNHELPAFVNMCDLC